MTASLDGHAHIWDTTATSGPPGPPENLDASLERLLHELDRAQVDRCVLMQPSHRGSDHSYLLHASQAHPARFRVVLLGVPSSSSALREIDGLGGPCAAVGIRLVPLRTPDLDWFGAGAVGLWELARARELAVFVLAAPAQLSRLRQALDRFGDVPVVVDHLGRPDLDRKEAWEGALSQLARYPNVFFKVSALGGFTTGSFPFRETWDWVGRVVHGVGAERLFWGSDFPYLGRASSLAEARAAGQMSLTAAGLSAGEVAMVMYGNATRLFWDSHHMPRDIGQ